jgi:hypothetical protein
LKGEYNWPAQQNIVVASGSKARAEIQLPLLGSLKGIAHIPPEKRAASVSLVLLHLVNQETVKTTVAIDAQQEFLVQHLDPGNYQARLEFPDSTVLQTQAQVIAGVQVLVEFKWDMATLEGYLEGGWNADPSLCLRQILSQEGTTAALAPNPSYTMFPKDGGHFLLSGVKPGSYLLIAQSQKLGLSLPITLEPHETKVIKCKLVNFQKLQVQVYQEENKAPLRGAQVTATRKPYAEIVRDGLSNEQGRAILFDLLPGDYEVLVQSRMTQPPCTNFTKVTLASEQPLTHVTVLLKMYGELPK